MPGRSSEQHVLPQPVLGDRLLVGDVVLVVVVLGGGGEEDVAGPEASHSAWFLTRHCSLETNTFFRDQELLWSVFVAQLHNVPTWTHSEELQPSTRLSGLSHPNPLVWFGDEAIALNNKHYTALSVFLLYLLIALFSIPLCCDPLSLFSREMGATSNVRKIW